jgi:hypothetical protein
MAVSPKTHPNGFAALSASSVAALLVTEAHNRLGVDISVEEAMIIVAAVTSAVLFAGRRLGVSKQA